MLINLLLISSCNESSKPSPCILENVETPFRVPCMLTRNIDTVEMNIQGTWTWLQQEEVQRGKPTKYLTPKTEGYSLELKLENDTATYYTCNKAGVQRRFDIIKWKDAPGSGTDGFPEGELPVLIFYDLKTGLRVTDVPIRICSQYLIMDYQFVRSIGGPDTWKKKSN